MKNHLDLMCVKRALKCNVPRATDYNYEHGDDVLLWKEKVHFNKKEFMGPFKVDSFDIRGKLVHIFNLTHGKSRPFNTTQIKHNLSSNTLSTSFLNNINDSLSQYKSSSINDDIFLTERIPV